MVLKIVQQGRTLVVRDEKGDPVKKSDGTIAKTLLPLPKSSKETWRKALARLTDDGRILDRILLDLAMGNAYEPVLPDGRRGEPVVPSPEVRRAAATDLQHMLRGKPVAQTEVLKAEKESEDLMQYSAFSDEQLKAIIEGEYKTLPNGDTPTGDEEPDRG